jgi:hypothetical protein
MPLSAIILSTEMLLAWVIVAIGVLGFIVAHTIPKWYKAILPALLALAVIGFGLYCVITISNEAKSNKPEEVKETSALEPGGSGARAPTVQPSAENLAANLRAEVPQSDTNPFHFRDEKVLKVKVEIRNNGRKAVTSAKLTCLLPYRSNPRAHLWKVQEFHFDQPLAPGAVTDVIFSFPNVANPDIFAAPQAQVNEAH